MTRSNIPIIRNLKDSLIKDESEILIMRKSQESFVKKVKINKYTISYDNIIFCSDEDEDNIDELNQAIIYSSNDKIMNDIKKWNCLRKLNKREPIHYCITQLEHVLNNVSNILERMNIENI